MTQVPDADQVADLLLPLDGPHHPDAAVEAARTVAELVRRLNHATFHASALRYPSDLYRVVGGLRSGLYGLEQTFGQLANRLDGWVVDPAVGHDQGRDPAVACAQAAAQLHRAAATLATVTGPLDAAHEITSHLNADNTTDTADGAQGRAFRAPATDNPSSPRPSPPPSPGHASPQPGRASLRRPR